VVTLRRAFKSAPKLSAVEDEPIKLKGGKIKFTYGGSGGSTTPYATLPSYPTYPPPIPPPVNFQIKNIRGN